MIDGNSEYTFTIDELSFMSRIVSDGNLYGFDFAIPALINPDFEEGAKSGLIEKKILSEDEEITKDGVYIFQIIEDYANSDFVVKINDLYIAQIPGNDLQVVTILEYADKIYKILVVDKVVLLKDLVVTFPILRREAGNTEKDFLEKRAKNSEKREMTDIDGFNEILKIEVLHQKNHELSSELTYYFQYGENIFETYDFEMNKVQRVSQYWLMNQVYRSVGIMIEKEVATYGEK